MGAAFLFLETGLRLTRIAGWIVKLVVAQQRERRLQSVTGLSTPPRLFSDGKHGRVYAIRTRALRLGPLRGIPMETMVEYQGYLKDDSLSLRHGECPLRTC